LHLNRQCRCVMHKRSSYKFLRHQSAYRLPRHARMPTECKNRSILVPSHWSPLGTASTTAEALDDGSLSTHSRPPLFVTHQQCVHASQSLSISPWLARQCPMSASDTTPTLLVRFTQSRRVVNSVTWRRHQVHRPPLRMDRRLQMHHRFLLERLLRHRGHCTLRAQSCRARRQAQSSTSTTNATASQSRKMATATSTRTRAM